VTGSPDIPYGPEDFARDIGVSRETLAAFRHYESLLVKWQKRINLIGPATLNDVWRRHFLDSAQLANLVPEAACRWVDLGSGAGFPGLVIALLLRARPGLNIHLIESDGRKSAFLRTVIRALDLPATVHSQRIEVLAPLEADVVTARALAPLDRLLPLAVRHRAENGQILLLKGQDVEKELTEASKSWIIVEDRLQSLSDPSGVILQIKEVHRGSA